MANIFEGSEKKLEIVVHEGVSLFAWPESRFQEILTAARAQVLSKIENPKIKAYLLSESSLFVWDDRMTLITCGTTTLAQAAEKALEFLNPDDICTFFYERKNEYFPHLQHTSFINDVELLRKKVKGSAYRLGNADEHHVQIFLSEKPYRPKNNDTTLEVLMYDMQGKARTLFNKKEATAEVIRKETGVDRIIPGFQVDDFVFDPVGYSLNAIKDDRYYTVHVTPQKEGAYASFETNLSSRQDLHQTVASALEVFQPRAFDVVYFDGNDVAADLDFPGFDRRSAVYEKFNCGYSVRYGHFSQPYKSEGRAVRLHV